MKRRWQYSILGLLVWIGVWMLGAIAPAQAHWADMAAAEIIVQETTVQMILTFPTGLVAFADEDQNGQLSSQEIQDHQSALIDLFKQSITLSNHENQSGQLTLQPLHTETLPPTVQIAPDTHSTLQLNYTWTQPLHGLRVHYGFFLPGISTAHCLATINLATIHQMGQMGQFKTFLFTPTRQTLALSPGLPGWGAGELLLAIAGAFTWGALHSLSPGHGKTVVGAYLVGERATPKHAFFLAMTTTITHTIGVFALGLVTLFAAQYILPEQLYPWLSLVSGAMVTAIGWNLLRKHQRLHFVHTHAAHQHHTHAAHQHHHAGDHEHHHPDCQDHHHSNDHPAHEHSTPHSHKHPWHDQGDRPPFHSHPPHEIDDGDQGDRRPILTLIQHRPDSKSKNHHFSSSSDCSDCSDCSDDDHYINDHHHHDHIRSDYHPHSHSHLPPGADGTPVTWRTLLALGISGGLVPCPAALVLLLGAIAFNQVGVGLVLVLCFSLGLAAVLTGLGLTLVYARSLFQKLPARLRRTSLLPRLSAVCITLVGLGLAIQALIKIIGI